MTDTNTPDVPDGDDGSSRRSFMKGAAALAGGYSVMEFDHVLDADGNVLGSASAQERGSSSLVFAWQFFPDLEFNLVTEIDNPEDILENLEGANNVDPVANPDEWDGFVISYQTATNYFAIAFFAQDTDVEEGDTFRYSPNASVNSQEFSLIDTDALVLEDGGGDGGDQETTTQAVVVDDGASNNSSS